MSRIVGRVLGPDWGIRSIGGYAPVDSPENREDIAKLVIRLLDALGATTLVAWVAAPLAGVHPAGEHFTTVAVLLLAGVLVLTPTYWLTRNRAPLWTLHLFATTTTGFLCAGFFLTGPSLVVLMIVGAISMSTLAFLMLQWRVALLYVVPAGAFAGVALARQPAQTAPWSRWIITVSGMAIIGATVAWLVNRIAVLAASERAARSAAAELNRTLKLRVAEQVDELNRLGKLRRFLSPQVADSLLTADSEAILQPHRRQIAVFYCDLRGFTRFSSEAEPEDVVEILDEYYRTVGALIHQFDATVGTFAGDGIMAYFNDPVPCDDPAYHAVQMALELQAPMAALVTSWTGSGYELGYGVGITYGYATLGMIGFEARNDYSAIGSVVNLAARLCSEAASGEILIDRRAMHALRDRVPGQARELVLKGIPGAVTAYLIGDRAAATVEGASTADR